MLFVPVEEQLVRLAALGVTHENAAPVIGRAAMLHAAGMNERQALGIAKMLASGYLTLDVFLHIETGIRMSVPDGAVSIDGDRWVIDLPAYHDRPSEES